MAVDRYSEKLMDRYGTVLLGDGNPTHMMQNILQEEECEVYKHIKAFTGGFHMILEMHRKRGSLFGQSHLEDELTRSWIPATQIGLIVNWRCMWSQYISQVCVVKLRQRKLSTTKMLEAFLTLHPLKSRFHCEESKGVSHCDGDSPWGLLRWSDFHLP